MIARSFNISLDKALNYRFNIMATFEPFIQNEIQNQQRMTRILAKTQNELVKMEAKLKSLPSHHKRSKEQKECAKELYVEMCKAAEIITFYQDEINV